jgi:rare lipoprotein A
MTDTLPHCRPIAPANGPAPARPRPQHGIDAANKKERNLQPEFKHIVKRNFNFTIATGVALTFGICGIVAANADKAKSHAQSGIASVYSTESGHGTASGQRLNPGALTAAHRRLPFGTKVRVTNRRNGRAVVVTINDRGPFVRGRVIDVTPAAARALGISGLAPVTLDVGG